MSGNGTAIDPIQELVEAAGDVLSDAEDGLSALSLALPSVIRLGNALHAVETDGRTALCLNAHEVGGWLCHEIAGHDGYHWSDGPGSAAW